MNIHLSNTFILGATIFSCITLSSSAQNLILNGDFELGNALFTSAYSYAPVFNVTEGQYTVTSNPNGWNSMFASSADHTPGGGTQMLAVNGASSGNPHFWQQTVPVSPFTNYAFQLHVSTAVVGGPAVIRLEINGNVVGDLFPAPDQVNTWLSLDRTWSSGASGTATIQLFDSNLAVFPNDFFIDDITFTVVPEPSSLALAGLALGALFVAQRRKQ